MSLSTSWACCSNKMSWRRLGIGQGKLQSLFKIHLEKLRFRLLLHFFPTSLLVVSNFYQCILFLIYIFVVSNVLSNFPFLIFSSRKSGMNALKSTVKKPTKNANYKSIATITCLNHGKYFNNLLKTNKITHKSKCILNNIWSIWNIDYVPLIDLQ